MAEMTPGEPQSAADYDDRTTTAVKTVLIEIGQILGSFKGKFAIVGGAVPWLLLGNQDMPHVGTLDVDLGLDAEALGDGEYATLIEALQGHGYHQRRELRRFQLVRQVPTEDGGAPIDIIVDFLMPRDAEIVKNVPPLISDFAVQRADGADLALRFYQLVAISGPMPAGGMNRVEIAVCSIPSLLAMKGHAIEGRYNPAGKDLGYMPGFGDSLTNVQIEELTDYLPLRFADSKAPWQNIGKTITRIRREHAAATALE